MARHISLLLTITLLLGLCGCSAVIPLKEKLIVEGIAVDDADGRFSVTVQVYSPADSTPKGYQLFEGQGATLYEALRHVDENAGKQSYYSDTRVIVFSRQSLQKGLWENLDYFIRGSAIGSDVCVAVATGKAKDLFTIESEGENFPAKVLANVLRYGRGQAHKISGELVNIGMRLAQPEADVAIPVIDLTEKEGKKYPDLAGVLCFRGDQPAVMLDQQTEWAYHWIQGYENERAYVVQWRGASYSLDILHNGSRVHADLQNGHPHFAVAVEMQCRVAESAVPGSPALSEMDAFQQAVEQDVCRVLQQAAEEVFRRRTVDVFNFGRALKKQQPDFFKQLDSWRAEIPFCTVSFQAHVTVTRAGQGVVGP